MVLSEMFTTSYMNARDFKFAYLNLTFLALIMAPPHPDIRHSVMAWRQFL